METLWSTIIPVIGVYLFTFTENLLFLIFLIIPMIIKIEVKNKEQRIYAKDLREKIK